MRLKRASIFLIAAWLLVMFGLFAAALYRMVYARLNVAERYRSWELSEYTAESVVNYLQAQLNTGGVLAKLQDQGKLGDVDYTYSLSNEESRINVNTASAEVLAQVPGFTVDSAQAVFSSLFKPFEAKEKLLLVKGFTQENLSAADEFITVKSSGKVNINTAPEKVLEYLGIDASAANAVLTYRTGADGISGTADDKFFNSSQDVVEWLSLSVSGTKSSDTVNNLFSGGILDTASLTFSLKLDTKVLGKDSMEYDIIFDNHHILAWREK
jgi:DNA uptake protein ComE-like DNA-binding protein